MPNLKRLKPQKELNCKIFNLNLYIYKALMNFDQLILPKNASPIATTGGKRRSRRHRSRRHKKSNKSRTRRKYRF
jgi:hypothetical protein